jgi:hypothetical protein
MHQPAALTLIGGRSAGGRPVTAFNGAAVLCAVLALKLASASLLLSMPNSTCEAGRGGGGKAAASAGSTGPLERSQSVQLSRRQEHYG